MEWRRDVDNEWYRKDPFLEFWCSRREWNVGVQQWDVEVWEQRSGVDRVWSGDGRTWGVDERISRFRHERQWRKLACRFWSEHGCNRRICDDVEWRGHSVDEWIDLDSYVERW